MKTIKKTFLLSAVLFLCLFMLNNYVYANQMPVIANKNDFYKFAKTLPLGITEKDNYQQILSKVEIFLNNYKSKNDFEKYSLLATKQALYGCKSGGYGIGAILVNLKGEVIGEAYNEMIQAGRSDLHGEMNLMDKCETNRKNPVNGAYQFPAGYIVYSSAEPCPMCMIRLATAGVDTYYVAKNDNDSMSRCIEKLPPFWRDVCNKHFYRQAPCSEDLSNVAYLLFYTYVFIEFKL